MDRLEVLFPSPKLGLSLKSKTLASHKLFAFSFRPLSWGYL